MRGAGSGAGGGSKQGWSGAARFRNRETPFCEWRNVICEWRSVMNGGMAIMNGLTSLHERTDVLNGQC